MKSIVLFASLLSGLLLSSVSFAQNAGGTEYLYSPSEGGVQGFRLGIMKALTSRGEVSEGSLSLSGDVPQTVGLKAGYANVNTNAVGFLGNLTVNLYDPKGDGAKDFQSYRLDGNATYGVAPQAYVYGGLNLAMISEGNFSTGFGFQLGGGYQFHPNFGVDLSYVLTKHGVEGSSADFTFSSIEVALMFSFN